MFRFSTTAATIVLAGFTAVSAAGFSNQQSTISNQSMTSVQTSDHSSIVTFVLDIEASAQDASIEMFADQSFANQFQVLWASNELPSTGGFGFEIAQLDALDGGSSNAARQGARSLLSSTDVFGIAIGFRDQPSVSGVGKQVPLHAVPLPTSGLVGMSMLGLCFGYRTLRNRR